MHGQRYSSFEEALIYGAYLAMKEQALPSLSDAAAAR